MKEKLAAFWAWLKPLLVKFKDLALANKVSFAIGLGIGVIVGLFL